MIAVVGTCNACFRALGEPRARPLPALETIERLAKALDARGHDHGGLPTEITQLSIFVFNQLLQADVPAEFIAAFDE